MPAHQISAGSHRTEAEATTASTAAPSPRRRRLGLLSGAAAAGLLLSACSEAGAGEAGADADGAGEVDVAAGEQIEDDHGTHTLPEEVSSVGVTDNRSFRTLAEFGVDISVAPRDLMDPGHHSEYASDEDILNLGNHREPDLEQIVAAQPDVVINGQRYAQYHQDIAELLDDDAVILEWDEAINDPATFHEGLTEKTQQLGEVFGAQEAAQSLVDDFDAQLERVESAYDGESSVMGLMTSGGDIQYLAPGDGRAIGPLFEMLDLQPALEQGVADDAHGDDISVEAIADAEPDWLLVIDRDATIESEEGDYRPADELISDSPALQNVPAVQNDNVVYAPEEMYLTEDIQSYTTFLGDFAEALESAD